MKAAQQNYGNGKLDITDVSAPCLRPGGILVRSGVSLVSVGTERQMVELAQKSLVGKAAERPDLVRKVIEKVKKDGLFSAIETVRSRLDNPTPLGYSSAGTVSEVGEGVEEFRVGDRVACAGAGYASHAEVVFVPQNLTVKLPDAVDFESAAFTTLGAIALQGLRLADVRLGETVAVIGVGLVGLLAVQLAKAAGCRVLGMDPNPERCRLAQKLGCEAALADNSQFAIRNSQLTSGQGADAVIITASTKSNDAVELAGEVARDHGVVVVVGSVGMEIPRETYYKKELTFKVSRSYGPGRYDSNYEEKGNDYPIGYVRWTENRNMQAFVQLLAEGKVNVKPLITHRFPIEEAIRAYDLITGKTKEPYLGILLTYSENPDLSRKGLMNETSDFLSLTPSSSDPLPSAPCAMPVSNRLTPRSSPLTAVRVGLLGAGEFARGTLLPAMKKVKGIEFVGVCTASGISSQHVAHKFAFDYATTDEKQILNDPKINTVAIATRHNLHARQVIAALKAGKHVFCEKPLCINEAELNEIIDVYHSTLSTRPSGLVLMVGYNRRFAPMALKLKELLADVHEPLVMHYRVNAGYIPRDHWVHNPEQGGGRIIGEICHFVDLLIFLTGSSPKYVHAKALPNNGRYREDNLSAIIEFTNGSIGTITYAANGDRTLSKERLEVFGGQCTAILDNFRKLEIRRNGKRQVIASRFHQDKGHQGEWQAFAGSSTMKLIQPISLEELVSVMRCTFSIARAVQQR